MTNDPDSHVHCSRCGTHLPAIARNVRGLPLICNDCMAGKGMSAEPIRWNTNAGLIPNHEGLRIRVLAKDVGSITEFIYVVAKDNARRHFLSTDGTLAGELPFHLVVAWRSE